MSYKFRKVVLRAQADLTADGQTSSVEMEGLPPGINPWNCVAFVVLSGTPTGTSPTLDITIQSSADGTVWVDEGAAETQLTAAANNIYVPTTPAKFYRLDLDIGGTNPNFVNLEIYAMVAIDGYAV